MCDKQKNEATVTEGLHFNFNWFQFKKHILLVETVLDNTVLDV